MLNGLDINSPLVQQIIKNNPCWRSSSVLGRSYPPRPRRPAP